MALLIYDGFDNWSQSFETVPNLSGAAGTSGFGLWTMGASSYAGSAYGGRTANVSNTASWNYNTQVANTSACIIGFRWNATLSNNIITIYDSVGAVQCGLGVSGGKVIMWRGTTATVLATGTTTILANSDNYFELKTQISSSANAELRINGITEFTLTGANTQNTGNQNWTVVGCSASVGGGVDLYDDFYLCDDTGPAPFNNFLGPVHVDTSYVTSSVVTGWTPLTSTNVSQVQDQQTDGDATYNATSTPGLFDSFNHSYFSSGATVSTPQTIYCAKVQSFARKTDVVYSAYCNRLVSPNGTVTLGAVRPGGLTTGYQMQEDYYPVDPATGLAWTQDSLSKTQIGYTLSNVLTYLIGNGSLVAGGNFGACPIIPLNPPAFVNVGTLAGSVSASSFSPAIPGSRVTGNMLVSFIQTTAARAPFSITNNWTIGDSNSLGAWAWRIVDGTETNPTWSWSGNVGCHAQVWQFTSNRTTFNVIGVTNNNLSLTATTPITVSGITPRCPGSLVCAILLCTADSVIGLPAGYTNIAQFDDATASDRVAYVVTNATSPVAAPSISQAINANSWSAFLFEIYGSPFELFNGVGSLSATGAFGFAQFDGANSNVTMTNANRTAQHSNTSTGGAISAVFKSSGKFYFEITNTTLTGGSTCLGLLLSTGTFANMGSGQNCACNFQGGSGQIWASNANSGKLNAYANGNIIGVAVDLTNHLIWFRTTNQSLWNGTGGADPGTGTGGITIASGSYAPAITYAGTGTGATEIMTGNLGNAAFALTVPSGFTSGWPGL